MNTFFSRRCDSTRWYSYPSTSYSAAGTAPYITVTGVTGYDACCKTKL